MAQQFHTAFSSEVSGVGIVAGGPYFCAQNKMIDALNRCMQTTLGMPTVQASLNEAKKMESQGLIDPVMNMKNSRVFFVSGKRDNTVLPKVVQVAVDTYKAWGVTEDDLIFENTLEMGHAFPTENFGNACPTPSESPFISKCGRDMAGEILTHLMGPLHPKTTPQKSHLYSFDQLAGLDKVDIDRLSMNKTGHAYIPEGCEFPEASGCSIHVAFHGCKQTLDDIKTTFVTETGYNAWAEANKIVVIYPQAVKSLLLSNPNGCWDWWGYSGDKYHTKEGLQMKQVAKIVKGIREGLIRMNAGTLEE